MTMPCYKRNAQAGFELEISCLEYEDVTPPLTSLAHEPALPHARYLLYYILAQRLYLPHFRNLIPSSLNILHHM
jgi:hypothetical protein